MTVIVHNAIVILMRIMTILLIIIAGSTFIPKRERNDENKEDNNIL